jgi:D-alanine transaminase
MSTCYLNGRYLPLDQAQVSVLDRGFLFGDGVYEVLPSFGGRLFRLTQHMRRLDNSLAAVRMANPLSGQEWSDVIREVLERNGGGDQSIYLQVTRGTAKRDHVLSEPVAQTVLVMSMPVSRHNEEAVSAITCEDFRWKLCQVKSVALLANVLMRMQAHDQGAYEAILIRDGRLTEGAASNVFVVKDGIIKTPPHSAYLLPGVTRDLIVELLRDNGLPIAETEVSEAEVLAADEIWITSSNREIVPVVTLNGKPVGDGQRGQVWEKALAIYHAYRDAHILGGTQAA